MNDDRLEKICKIVRTLKEEGPTMSVGAQTIALNSGTIKDASGTASDAALVISEAVGTAAGTVTVTA